MATQVTFKRGTSFSAACAYDPDAGGQANLLDTTVTSDIIDSSGNIYSLTIDMAGNGLSFTASYASSSADWALGMARWDLKFSYSGAIYYSETLRLNIIDQVTA
jgi:hypothetical protein